MTGRSYTVAEIDALRSVCRDRYIWGTTCPRPIPCDGFRLGRSYKENELEATVEQHVRTYMLAGITAEDIRAEDKRHA